MKAKSGFTLIISLLLWACLQANGYEITNLTQLTNGPVEESGPSFNFTGTKIAYRYLHEPYSWDNCDIWVINTNGSGNTRLTTDTNGEFHPRFAPDGRVSYTKEFGSNDYDIWLCNSDGSNPHQLIAGSYRQSEPRWHPSGTKIVYYSEYRYYGPGEIWSANTDGSGKVKLTDHTIDGYCQPYPLYSRSGNLIAYANYVTSSADSQIWIMNADGSGKHQMTTGPGSLPMFWWPDDSLIGYTKDGEVWLYNISTGTDELLLSVPNGNIDWADLSLDGSKLVFGLSISGVFGQHIWIGDVVSGSLNQLPIAVPDIATTQMNNPVSFNVLDNDSDPDGDPIIAILLGSGITSQGGTVTLNPDGTCTYTPATEFVGEDSFTYKAYDGELYSAVTVVTITVTDGGASGVTTVTEGFTEQFTSGSDAFDLSNKAIMFTPTTDGSFYNATLSNITQLPTDPAGGTNLALDDDSYTLVNLNNQTRVSIFGYSYTRFYVGSDGYISFISGDIRSRTLSQHFESERISVLFDDFDPFAGGQVSWKQLADRVVVTWENVPEFETSNSNTFQVEMYFDGRIQLSWLDIATTNGIVGLSQGLGWPEDFQEIDFSALPTTGTGGAPGVPEGPGRRNRKK